MARHSQVAVGLPMLDRTVNLVEERVDLAIRMAHERDPNLIARQLSVCRSVLCASPAYLATRGTPQRPEDLVRHNCLTHHFVGKSLWALGRGADAVSVAVGGNISANDASAVMAAVLADAGIGLLPTYLAAPHLRDGSLVQLLPPWPPKTMGIYAVYASRQRMPPAVRAFLDVIADRLGDAPPWDVGIA
ncbi:MAG TPA: substrate binding domain-containing protein [Dyella sp.]|nr:substrate binding domain-containing protein [Dyella sp.]